MNGNGKPDIKNVIIEPKPEVTNFVCTTGEFPKKRLGHCLNKAEKKARRIKKGKFGEIQPVQINTKSYWET